MCANTVCITKLWTSERSRVWCEDEELPSEDYTFITRELQVKSGPTNQIDKQEHAHPPRPEVRPEAGGERDLGRRTTSNDW